MRKMNKCLRAFVGAMVLGLLVWSGTVTMAVNETWTIIDMAGRRVTTPKKIQKVFSTSQIGTIFMYTLAPEKIAGWSFAFSETDKKYIQPEYLKLPVLGTWSGKNGTINIEKLIQTAPDLILSIGSLTEMDISSAERLQEQSKIPVVLVDGSLTKLDKAYKFVGDLLAEKNRAKELGDYCRETIATIEARKAEGPLKRLVRVYYAEGPKGLESDPKGSFHTEVLDFVGGINVAEVPKLQGYGRSQVSMEQLLAWDPQVILVGNDKDTNVGAYDAIMTNPDWEGIQGIKNHRVYRIPAYPFDWFDRPPGVNRVIGVRWLANLLYPGVFKMDIKAETKRFYQLFYHCSLTGPEVEEILSGTLVR